jgi:chitodextrinase
VASPGQVSLAWQANLENDLARYNLYQGTQIGNLNKVAEVLAGTETLTVTGLNNGATYFFAIDAEDKSGNRSLRSNEVSATPNLLQQVCVFDNPATSFDNCVFN